MTRFQEGYNDCMEQINRNGYKSALAYLTGLEQFALATGKGEFRTNFHQWNYIRGFMAAIHDYTANR